jgi:hypothetical protein
VKSKETRTNKTRTEKMRAKERTAKLGTTKKRSTRKKELVIPTMQWKQTNDQQYVVAPLMQVISELSSSSLPICTSNGN